MESVFWEVSCELEATKIEIYGTKAEIKQNSDPAPACMTALLLFLRIADALFLPSSFECLCIPYDAILWHVDFHHQFSRRLFTHVFPTSSWEYVERVMMSSRCMGKSFQRQVVPHR